MPEENQLGWKWFLPGYEIFSAVMGIMNVFVRIILTGHPIWQNLRFNADIPFGLLTVFTNPGMVHFLLQIVKSK